MNQIVGKTEKGRDFVALILEPGNVTQLTQQHRPIVVRVEDLFPEGIPRRLELAILYSDTPVADARVLMQSADVAFDERTPTIKKTRPHCPECKSTVEQMGALRAGETTPMVIFCPVCGCTLGIVKQ